MPDSAESLGCVRRGALAAGSVVPLLMWRVCCLSSACRTDDVIVVWLAGQIMPLLFRTDNVFVRLAGHILMTGYSRGNCEAQIATASASRSQETQEASKQRQQQ